MWVRLRVRGGPRSVNEEMAASTSRAMSSTQCATTPSLHAPHNTPMKLLFVRVALDASRVRIRGVDRFICHKVPVHGAKVRGVASSTRVGSRREVPQRIVGELVWVREP